MFADVVDHSDFLLDPHEYAHFGQLDLVDVEVAHIVAEVGTGDQTLGVYAQDGDVVQASSAQHVASLAAELKGVDFVTQGVLVNRTKRGQNS